MLARRTTSTDTVFVTAEETSSACTDEKTIMHEAFSALKYALLTTEAALVANAAHIEDQIPAKSVALPDIIDRLEQEYLAVRDTWFDQIDNLWVIDIKNLQTVYQAYLSLIRNIDAAPIQHLTHSCILYETLISTLNILKDKIDELLRKEADPADCQQLLASVSSSRRMLHVLTASSMLNFGHNDAI